MTTQMTVPELRACTGHTQHYKRGGHRLHTEAPQKPEAAGFFTSPDTPPPPPPVNGEGRVASADEPQGVGVAGFLT